ncbi:MAG: hypothetical protein Q8K93_03940 [Reyranella sp.]|uniref:hypothetical protein n=1 Tax=Reyranella sp. TaxID=1929291 RepID=UPI00272F4E12|nr:hypothetical protein [Reyranella sp.]MDP1961334.1 hypothetical protein [Reyranella sp.]MDP2372342.1 hypothetical protein [Reyranella sp.]
MSKLRGLPYAVLTIGLLAAGSASAQSMWSIDQRDASQQQRINEGRRDGSLKHSEANRLQQTDNRNDRYEARARSDGRQTEGRNGWGGRDGHGGRDDSRGNYRGGDNNRGNHYGWDNNRGNHYGWDHANRNGRGDNDRHQGGVNRPERSTHTGWNGGTRGQPQPVTSVTTSNGGRNNRR